MSLRVKIKSLTEEAVNFLSFIRWSYLSSPEGRKGTFWGETKDYGEKIRLSNQARVDPDKHKLDKAGNLISVETKQVVYPAKETQHAERIKEEDNKGLGRNR